jgi:SH3 domain protein
MRRILPSAAVALLAAASAGAETAYVTDILRLGIHQASDTNDRAFDSLVSGTPLEVLERSTNYARVRMQDGREGWVKAAYLVIDKPAQLRVAEVEAELAALRDRVTVAEAERAQAVEEAERISRDVRADEHSVVSMRESLTALQRRNGEYETRLEQYRASLPWRWVVSALLLAAITGFAAGWWWLDARIRRRYGGYRIY